MKPNSHIQIGIFRYPCCANERKGFGVKRQYLGDVNDYRKYCLLRHFADDGQVSVVFVGCSRRRHGHDGRKTAYLDQPRSGATMTRNFSIS